jgi:hypothetical protein
MMRIDRWKLWACPVVVAAAFFISGPAPAQSPADKSGFRVEEQDSVAAVLKRLEGKAVKLRLAGGGEEISGKITKVGKEVVHVTDLSGRDFYDAVVRIDQVAAVSVQVRGR